MNAESKFIIPKDVVCRTVKSEGIIVNLATGTYFSLNESALRIWEMLSERQTVAEIVDSMKMHYPVDGAILRADILETVETLYQKQLIQPE